MSTALHVTNPFSSDQNTASPLPIAPKLDPLHFEIAPAKLQRLLGTVSNWDFDVILLEEITEKRYDAVCVKSIIFMNPMKDVQDFLIYQTPRLDRNGNFFKVSSSPDPED